MFDVIFYSFSAGFFSILLGVGIYILYREKINEFPVKEKINGLITHFQKYRYWYIAIIIIMLVPILYYLWDVFFNPYRINYFPGPNVPPPAVLDKRDNFFSCSLKIFVALIEGAPEFFARITIIVIVMSLVLVLPRISMLRKNGFLFEYLKKIAINIYLLSTVATLIIIGLISTLFDYLSADYCWLFKY